MDGVELDFVLKVLSEAIPDAEVRPHATEAQTALGMLVKGTYLHVNVQKSDLVLAVAMLDAALTRGLGMAFLTASGEDLRCWSVLDPVSDEYCTFLSAYERRKAVPLSADTLTRSRVEMPCPHPGIRCTFNKNGVCGIEKDATISLLSQLRDKKVLALDNVGNILSLAL